MENASKEGDIDAVAQALAEATVSGISRGQAPARETRPWAAITPQDIINYAANIAGEDDSFRDTTDEDLADAEAKARQ
eukprot:3143450-Lingulodinium_polyedra.AAC.1